jgi:hypothetical protein
MSVFNKTVLIIAIIILSAALISLGVTLSYSMFDDASPPVVSDCPDYWDVSYNSSNDVVCQNTSTVNKGRSDCNAYPVSLFNQGGTGKDDIICEKYKWAKNCGIVWDGVSNNVAACGKNKL